MENWTHTRIIVCQLEQGLQYAYNLSTGNGPLMSSPQCHLSIFRTDNAPCCYFEFVPVYSEIVHYRLYNFGNILCHVGNIFSRAVSVMSPVDLLKNGSVALLNLKVKGPSDGRT